MKKKRLLLCHLIVGLLIIAAIVLLVRHFRIEDFHIVKPEVLYVSGQPRGMDYVRLLYRYHIATIVNVRLNSECRDHNWYHEETNWAKDSGVNYIELPIEKANCFPDERTQEQFLDVMSAKGNLPVLLHGCRDDERVAMLTAVWLRRAQSYSAEGSIGEVKKIIDGRKLTEAEIKFIRNLAN